MKNTEVLLVFAKALQDSVLTGQTVTYHLMDKYTMLEIEKAYKIVNDTKLNEFK